MSELASYLGKGIDKKAKKVTRQAMEKLKDKAANRLHRTRMQYENALSFKQIGPGVYGIVLDKSAVHLEEGYCVLYSKGTLTEYQPKVFTENGWKAVSEIRIGDMVLNKNGEFTKVLKIHESDLLGSIRLIPEFEGKLFSKYGPGTYKRGCYSLTCPKCGHQELQEDHSAFNRVCPICISSEFIIRISIGTKSLNLTKDHLVLTSEGYKEAQYLTDQDSIITLSDSFCKLCAKPLPIERSKKYNSYCSKSCSAKETNSKLLKEGRHYSQIETEALRRQWAENCTKARRRSGLENHFHEEFKGFGYEIKRQHPIKIIKNNGNKTQYWLDFYLPEFKLGIEMDGTAFHDPNKDAIRDSYIKEQHDIDIIRINNVDWKKDRNECIQRVIRRISNHEGLFAYVPRHLKVEHVPISNGFNMTTKFDITVENGSSFVCQGIAIHNSGFDMKPGMLNSETTVKTGKRAGEKWVRTNKKTGKKWAVVPFETNMAAANENHPLANAKVQIGQDTETDMRSLALNMKMAFRKAGLGGITKGTNGAPIEGVVGRIKTSPTDPNQGIKMIPGAPKESFSFGKSLFGTPNTLDARNEGAVKVQYKDKNSGKVKSSYMTFRIVSEDQKGKWIHPGWMGLKGFGEIADWAEKELLREIEDLLSIA